MHTVYEAADLIDAHLMLHRLQDAGIEAQVLGTYLSGGIGELPLSGLIRVVVADADVQTALDVVAAAAPETDDAAGDAAAEPPPHPA